MQMRSSALAVSDYDLVDMDTAPLFKPTASLVTQGESCLDAIPKSGIRKYFDMNKKDDTIEMPGWYLGEGTIVQPFWLWSELERPRHSSKQNAVKKSEFARHNEYIELSFVIIGITCLAIGLIGIALAMISFVEGVYSFVLPTGFSAFVFLSISFAAIYIRKTMKKSWRTQKTKITGR